MEQIIKNLLQADNELITKATADLQEAYKSPESISALCELVVSSEDAAVRQYSAQLLKKRLAKLRNWNGVHTDHQNLIRNGMLQAIQNEPQKVVRAAIAGFVGILVRHEFGKGNEWERQVLSLVFDNIASAEVARSELGAEIFANLADIAPDQMVKHLELILNMYTSALSASVQSGNLTSNTLFNILVGVGHLVTFSFGLHNSLSERMYTDSIPYLLKSLNAFALKDEDQFVKAFDILEELADANAKVLTPHLTLIINFCIETAKNGDLEEGIRVKVLTYIGWLIRLKKKQVIKLKLVEPLIMTLFELMATASEEDDEEEYFGSNDVSTAQTCAAQTLDVLALNVPPKQLIPSLLALLEPAFKNGDARHKKAAYLSIAVIAEGCSEAISTKYLRPLLDCVKTGIVDEQVIVRNAAFFALGQFSEHLQPEISQYAEEILPFLFNFLRDLCNRIQSGQPEPAHIDRVFYALETYCENLEEALVPHVPALMEQLIPALAPSNTVHLRELALSTVTAVTNAAKMHMLPYMQQLTEILNPYLVVTDDEDICSLRPAAVDALAALARQIGREHFLVIAHGTMNIGLTLLDDSDPDMRRSCYNLFASIASCVHEEMASAPMEKIVKTMIDSVKSTEGIIPTFNDNDDTIDVIEPETEGQNENDEIDIENSDCEDDEEVNGFSVENAYMDEKEEAIVALMELAEHTGIAFAPYIQVSFEEIYKLINFPNEDIRRVSITALRQFVISLYKLKNEDGAKQAITILIPKLSEIIRTDDERVVVMTALEAFNDILKEVGTIALTADGQKEAIFGCITDVLNGKVVCQYEEPVDEEQEESEYDEAIIQTAGDILPRFGLALSPQEFTHYFSQIFPYFIHKIEKTKHKDETTDSQRSFAIGVLSECFGALKDQSAPWFDTLLPLFLSCVQDRNDEVRNNTIFGLGEMVLHSGEISFKYYSQILSTLSHCVANETHAGTLDNICGAIARLIIANSQLVPLKDVLPVFVQYLPLREDYDENLAVFKSLALVYQQGDEALVPLIERITVIGLTALAKKQYSSDESKEIITGFVRQVQQQFPDKFTTAAAADPELTAFIQSF